MFKSGYASVFAGDENWNAIAVPQGGYTTLNLAGAGVNGSQTNQPITLTFTDG